MILYVIERTGCTDAFCRTMFLDVSGGDTPRRIAWVCDSETRSCQAHGASIGIQSCRMVGGSQGGLEVDVS